MIASSFILNLYMCNASGQASNGKLGEIFSHIVHNSMTFVLEDIFPLQYPKVFSYPCVAGCYKGDSMRSVMFSDVLWLAGILKVLLGGCSVTTGNRLSSFSLSTSNLSPLLSSLVLDLHFGELYFVTTVFWYLSHFYYRCHLSEISLNPAIM